MSTKRARITTPLSCFCALLSIASCLRIETTGPESTSPDAFVPGTSLVGPIQCGFMQCPSGSLCTHLPYGHDAGAPADENVLCTSVPSGCRVDDCNDLEDRCSTCINALCSSPDGYGVSVIGRDLYCPGW
jgi:hypothetical protein